MEPQIVFPGTEVFFWIYPPPRFTRYIVANTRFSSGSSTTNLVILASCVGGRSKAMIEVSITMFHPFFPARFAKKRCHEGKILKIHENTWSYTFKFLFPPVPWKGSFFCCQFYIEKSSGVCLSAILQFLMKALLLITFKDRFCWWFIMGIWTVWQPPWWWNLMVSSCSLF